jgi:excisionase family DNA binding protein
MSKQGVQESVTPPAPKQPVMVPPYRDIYPIAEAAFLLGNISPKHLRNLINAGRVNAVRLGKSVRVSRDEIERIAREGC